jgi:2-oxoglutarate dehydrogenase E2 component (dihydrolipoamide succinyltransferase)
MSIEIRVPALPESVADATLLTWHKQPGESVRQDENLVDLETDKVVLEVPAPKAGILQELRFKEGDTVIADQVLALLDDARTATAAAPAKEAAPPKPEAVSPKPEAVSPGRAAETEGAQEPVLTPAVRRLVKEFNLDPHQITGTGKDGRILKADVMNYLDAREREQPAQDRDFAQMGTGLEALAPGGLSGEAERPEQRVPMTRLRARVAERLLQAQQNAAILTTFNEVNLQGVMDLRKRHREQFEKVHEVRLGFMSFFVKAAVEALKRFPVVNASVDGQDIIYHGYYDIGIAVSSPRGLVVPILRDCDRLSFAEIEQGIREFGEKAKAGTLSYEELTGGTFSISNGGVFGSMLSTPILNPPQSAILGMHATQERPMVEDGQIVVRPMMYLALSYDHRIIDGREAVQFLVTIKQTLEDPARLLLQV